MGEVRAARVLKRRKAQRAVMGFMAKGVGGGLGGGQRGSLKGIGGAHDFFGFAGWAAMPSKGEAGIVGGGMATTQCLVCGEVSPF